MKELPVPRTVRQVRSALGAFQYYRMYVPLFSVIAAPLYNLLQKDAKFVWTPECQQAFDKLKHLLTTAPVLAYYVPGRPKRVETDASLFGLGSVLLQEDPDGMHPIAYASRTLTIHERNYSAVELELLAIIWSVTLPFAQYLFG